LYVTTTNTKLILGSYDIFPVIANNTNCSF
jgi:hypothetical protein